MGRMDDIFNPRPVYPPLSVRDTPAGPVSIIEQDPPRLAKIVRGTGPYSWREQMLQPTGEYIDLGDAGLAGSCEVVMDGTTGSGSATVSGLADTTGLVRGQPVSGTGVPAGARILTVDSASQVTLTANATASGTASLTFAVFAAAYERNLVEGVGIGTFVLLWRGYLNTGNDESQEWIFDRRMLAVENDLTWTITTTLAAAITTATQSTATVADAGKFPSRNCFVVQIDDEQLMIGAGYGTNNWSSIVRGWNGTTPAPHGNGATVTLVQTSPVSDVAKLIASMVFETYPGPNDGEVLILNQAQPINVTSGPDGSGFFSGNRIEYNPQTEAIDTKEAIRAIDLNNFP